jgi:hypothetical protein
MRWGELVGLRRSSVDVRRLKVRVTEQLVQLDSREFVRRDPKTAAGIRSITIAPFTGEILASHLERFANPGEDGLVFPNAAGNPLASASFLTHHFLPAQRQAGVRCRSTTSGTRAWLWRSPLERTRNRSRRGWATPRSS